MLAFLRTIFVRWRRGRKRRVAAFRSAKVSNTPGNACDPTASCCGLSRKIGVRDGDCAVVRAAGVEPARASRPYGFSYHFGFRRRREAFVVWTIPSP